jgi:hypothetical protein
VSLLDTADQAPPSKTPRYVMLALLAILIVGFFVWRAVRFKTEEQTVETFLNALVSGNMQQAYQLWQPTSSYTLKDFQDDWGPSGYYGPVKSFEIDSAFKPTKSSSDVAVRVLLSPYQPFPKNDTIEQNKTKSVTIWVNRNTHSLSTGPPGT